MALFRLQKVVVSDRSYPAGGHTPLISVVCGSVTISILYSLYLISYNVIWKYNKVKSHLACFKRVFII